MNTVIRLALIGASIAALSAPALARHGKGDRMVSRHTTGEMATAPIGTHRAALSGTDWDARYGYDRASSPFGHGGY